MADPSEFSSAGMSAAMMAALSDHMMVVRLVGTKASKRVVMMDDQLVVLMASNLAGQ